MTEDLICGECHNNPDCDGDPSAYWVAHIWIGRVLSAEFDCWPEGNPMQLEKISIGKNREASYGEVYNGADEDPRLISNADNNRGRIKKIAHNCPCGCDWYMDADQFNDKELEIINNAIKRYVHKSWFFTLQDELNYCNIEVYYDC